MKRILIASLIILTVTGLLKAQERDNWVTSGNSPITTHCFLGTNNTCPLQIRTNGSTRMYISPTGDVGIGAMNALLLEKVEELTRYVIDLQNQIDELKKGEE